MVYVTTLPRKNYHNLLMFFTFTTINTLQLIKMYIIDWWWWL